MKIRFGTRIRCTRCYGYFHSKRIVSGPTRRKVQRIWGINGLFLGFRCTQLTNSFIRVIRCTRRLNSFIRVIRCTRL